MTHVRHGAPGIGGAPIRNRGERIVIAGSSAVFRSRVGGFFRVLGDDPIVIDSIRELCGTGVADFFTAVVAESPSADAADLEELIAFRNTVAAIPIIVVAREATAEGVNSVHCLGAEMAVWPDIADNLLAFRRRAIESPWGRRCRRRRSAEAFARSHRLTDSQRRVLLALIDGVPRNELSAHLQISKNTVKSHVRKLLSTCVRALDTDDLVEIAASNDVTVVVAVGGGGRGERSSVPPDRANGRASAGRATMAPRSRAPA